MGYSSEPLNFVQRFGAATVLTTIALVTGAYFLIKGPVTGLPAAGARVYVIQTGSGYLRGYIDDTGAAAFSGALVLGRNNSGSGKLTLQGADGGKTCVMDTDGAGYTVTNECLNGTCTDRAATGTECP